MDNFRTSSIFHFISSDSDLPRLRELLASGEDPNCQAYGGFTPLIEAINSSHRNYDVIQELIDRGADVNLSTHLSFSPLHFAILHRRRAVIGQLINAGAFVNAKTFRRNTPLHFAVTEWIYIRPLNPLYPEPLMVQQLLKHEDIDLNSLGALGQTPLMVAVRWGQAGAAFRLLAKQANPNICDKFSDSPLHVAFAKEEFCIERMLLRYGASIYSVNKSGRNPLDILLSSNRRSISNLKILLKLIVFKYRITNDLKEKLESNPELSQYLDECCQEVGKMRKDIISNNTTVHDFVLQCFNEDQFENMLLQVHKPVMDRLVRGAYFEYFREIFEFIPFTSMLDILQMTAHLKTSAKKSKIKDLAYLFSILVICDQVSMYLHAYDIFCLIVALSNVEPPRLPSRWVENVPEHRV